MNLMTMLVGLAIVAAEPPPKTAADVVTLADGKVVLGQVLGSASRSGWPNSMLVRRAWAEKHLPERAALWAKAEASTTRQANANRLQNLKEWRRDRPQIPVEGDRITPRIDREIARLSAPDDGSKSVLMVVNLTKADVKSIGQKSQASKRMIRLGWLSDFPEVESIAPEDLSQALEGRGFTPQGNTPVSIDSLLPPRPEAGTLWLVRRASTEVINDPGGRFLRYQGVVLPEPPPGEAPPAGESLGAALSGLKELLGEVPVDPLPGKLRDLAGQGRIGAVVTRLDLSPDFSSVVVETSLWVRTGVDRWSPTIVRSSTVRPDDLPANASEGLADDPQVKAAFGVVESLGLGQIPPEYKQRSLKIGAATRKALGQARGALDLELNSIALSLEARQAPKP